MFVGLTVGTTYSQQGNIMQGPLGKYNEMLPYFFTHEGVLVPLQGLYRGCSGFLACNGPSLAKIDTSQMNRPGVLTIGLNNGPSVFRPDIHVCGDAPCRFLASTWLDPKILKIIPISSFSQPLWDSTGGKWEPLVRCGKEIHVRDCPNCVGIHRNDKFKAEQWLFEDSFGWGNKGDFGGKRSVMMLAVKIMFILGVRRLFIVGADFKMDAGSDGGYAFKQNRPVPVAKHNNKAYDVLNDRFRILKEYFDTQGFCVYNSVAGGGPTAFPYVPYEDAIRVCTDDYIGDVKHERTDGMYEVWDHWSKNGKTRQDIAKLSDAKKKEKLSDRKEYLFNRKFYEEHRRLFLEDHDTFELQRMAQLEILRVENGLDKA